MPVTGCVDCHLIPGESCPNKQIIGVIDIMYLNNLMS